MLTDKLSQFRFDAAFDIELCSFGFFEPRVIYVHVDENKLLEELHGQLKRFAQRELKLLNEVSDERGFHPHVTVAFRDLKKPKFYELQKKFMDRHFNGRFTYAGFSLLRFEKIWEEIRFFPLIPSAGTSFE